MSKLTEAFHKLHHEENAKMAASHKTMMAEHAEGTAAHEHHKTQHGAHAAIAAFHKTCMDKTVSDEIHKTAPALDQAAVDAAVEKALAKFANRVVPLTGISIVAPTAPHRLIPRPGQKEVAVIPAVEPALAKIFSDGDDGLGAA